MRPTYEVADVLRVHWPRVPSIKGMNGWKLRTLKAVLCCRTADLGAHKDVCTGCGTIEAGYNSCRNRHCPKCQGHKREQWIAARAVV